MKNLGARAKGEPFDPAINRDFPSARYFQIHFEHLHAALAVLGYELEHLKRQLAELQRQLEWRPPGGSDH
ncbi:hypothetical protein [Candidatus Methylocalor cossyra]|uniref:Uncharacterized protein n=1 Tax=Candidatus Methylocalor cossyra TaxID=3108543 RepID=A0ABP1CAC3_9GAMM